MFRTKITVSAGAAAAIFLTLPAMAAHNPPPFGLAVPYQTTEQCTGGSVSICGQSVPAPNLPLGYSVTLGVPSPYVHQSFTVQCTSLGYQITDSSSVTCALQTCPAMSVPLCGTSLAIPAGTTIGNSVTVPVPVAALADPSSASSLTFTAQCVSNSDGDAVYQPAPNPDISCNIFPCADSHIRLCETLIPIDGGTPLGGVLHLSMPPPFAPDPFMVECIGSQDDPPAYRLVDGSGVTCATLPPAP